MPRVDYLNNSNGSLILEPQRTNSLLYSEDFTQGVFSNASSSTTSENCMTFGSAIELIEDTANNVHGYTFDDRSGSTNDYVTSSYYIKKNTRTKVRIYNYYLSNQYAFADWDLNTKTLINSGAANMTFVSSNLIDLSDGWVKLEITSIKSTSTYSYHARIQMLDNSGNTTYVGDGSSSIFVRAAQTELAAQYSTSYIPTNGTSVTRNADVCNNAGTSATFNSTEGVLFAEMVFSDDNEYKFISLNSGSSTNRAALYSNSPTSISVNVRNSSGNQFNGNFSIDSTINHKIALKYKENDFALWIDGQERLTDSSGTTFTTSTLSELSFDDGSGGSDFYGKCKQLIVFDEALSDEELQTLTT